MDTKSNKNYGTTFFALAFIVAIFFELYFIMTNPYNYFMLIGIGIIMIILGYLTFDSISKAKEAAAKQLNEQNEMMLKASKAIYLATKRNTQETQKQHAQNIKAIEYMMNNMISNEKDMVNAMITKNEEIAAKQITAKPEGNDMSSLIEQLSASNAKLAKEVQSAITVNELVKANADLVKNVREVLGNSQSALDNSNLTSYVNSAVNSSAVVNGAANTNTNANINANTTANMNVNTASVQEAFSNTATNVVADAIPNPTNNIAMEVPNIQNTTTAFFADTSNANNLGDDTYITETPVANNTTIDTPVVNIPVADTPIAEAPATNDTTVDSPVVNATMVNTTVVDTPIVDTPVVEAPIVEAPIVEAPSAELYPASSTASTDDMEQEEDEFDFESFEIPEDADDVQIADGDTASSKEIIDDVNVSALDDMVETEGNTIAPEVSSELDKEMSSTPSDSAMAGLDDNPNRQLTEEEIAALFANL